MKQKTTSVQIMVFFVLLFLLYQCGGSGLRNGSIPNADFIIPEAEYIIDRHLRLTGAEEVGEKIFNIKKEMTLTIIRNGAKHKITTYQQKPNLFYACIEFDYIDDPPQKWQEGTDGNIVWVLEPRTIGRILEGEERANKLLDYAFNDLGSWRTYFRDIKCTGLEDIDGKLCYKVVLTPFMGDDRVYFFEKNTFLLTKKILFPPKIDPDIEAWFDVIVKNQLGEKPLTRQDKLENYLSDYRKINEIWFSHKTKQISGSYEIYHIDIDNVETNIDMPENMFDPPEKIKRILQKEGVWS